MDLLGFAGNRKCIPGWILGLPLSRLKWFIEGYREGDGVHSGDKLDGTLPVHVDVTVRRAQAFRCKPGETVKMTLASDRVEPTSTIVSIRTRLPTRLETKLPLKNPKGNARNQKPNSVAGRCRTSFMR